ncbi:MAG: SUMF1/EgtB/PvdO family nonheme iron enzyme [Bacteroidetes bacterium]|nr:SUMF1/EgtB/PvdO family nonheme iron enzyme [Bacteroidota bacterium]
MSINNKHKVSEKELDNLLGQAFLNLDFNKPKNQELMETISNQVMHTSPVGIINKAFFTKLISVVAIIVTSVFIYFNYFRNTHNQTIKNTASETIINSTTEQSTENQKLESVIVNTNNVIDIKKEATILVSESIQQQEPTNNESPKYQMPLSTNFTNEKKARPEDTSYVFPKLTDKEIKETKRQKEVMAMALLKPNKYLYPLIGDSKEHKYAYGKATDTSSVFNISTTEVTNLQYRTFLFDLLINEDKETFIKAKPHQYLWLNAPGHAKTKDMKDNYFSNKKYNDYPVVNVTPEGAELYCQWLSNIVEISNGKVIARLPYENEWVKAARHKGVNPVYPWPIDSIQNRVGCHLANFCIQKREDQLRKNMRCVPKNKDAYASAEFMLGDSMMTTKVFSYNPNDNGTFCMVGNVAEMVYDNKTKTVITKGGSWNSDFEQCKLYNKEELNGAVKANPMTGFRPVFRIKKTHSFGSIERDNDETGAPVLTSEEIASTSKEKKKMIDALVKFNKEKYVMIPMGSFLYKKDTFSVQSFYMETTEVTNLEYRTFLADLLIQKRNSDYVIAKPNQEAWMTRFPDSYNEPMTNMYFWHPAYDEYPVVNISRKGAELYCEWLTIEANKILKETNKPLMNDLRIPVDLEWAYAASSRKNQPKYANGNEYLRDSKGKYEMNYMCYSKEQCRYDSIKKLHVPKKEIVDLKSKEENPGFVADGAFHTSTVKGYNPNSYGLYGMAGNVSEMVNTFDKKTMKYLRIGTKGGSWFSCDYFLEIDADDEYPDEVEASPLIGFRPVFTAPKVTK